MKKRKKFFHEKKKDMNMFRSIFDVYLAFFFGFCSFMLKNVTAKILSHFLSEYIAHIDSSQLEMSIWNGIAKLENVNFLEDAFISHHIPLSIKKGIVGSLSLVFPWGKLDSQPCVITIENIFSCTDIKGKALISGDLQAKQKNNTSSNQEMDNEKSQNDDNYFKGIMGKIIDNLEVNIKNVHIRVELSQSSDQYTTIGLMIKNISVYSVNNQNEKAFIVGEHEFVNKKIDIEGLALYIDTNKKTIDITDNEIFVKEMSEIETIHEHQYILNHFNFQSNAKIKVRNISKEDIRTQIQLSITDAINFALDENQWLSINHIMKEYNNFQLRRVYSHCGRPNRPVRSYRSGGLWWAYANNCAIETVSPSKFDPKTALTILKNRKKYFEIYKQKDIVELEHFEEGVGPTASLFLKLYAESKISQENKFKINTSSFQDQMAYDEYDDINFNFDSKINQNEKEEIKNNNLSFDAEIKKINFTLKTKDLNNVMTLSINDFNFNQLNTHDKQTKFKILNMQMFDLRNNQSILNINNVLDGVLINSFENGMELTCNVPIIKFGVPFETIILLQNFFKVPQTSSIQKIAKKQQAELIYTAKDYFKFSINCPQLYFTFHFEQSELNFEIDSIKASKLESLYKIQTKQNTLSLNGNKVMEVPQIAADFDVVKYHSNIDLDNIYFNFNLTNITPFTKFAGSVYNFVWQNILTHTEIERDQHGKEINAIIKHNLIGIKSQINFISISVVDNNKSSMSLINNLIFNSSNGELTLKIKEILFNDYGDKNFLNLQSLELLVFNENEDNIQITSSLRSFYLILDTKYIQLVTSLLSKVPLSVIQDFLYHQLSNSTKQNIIPQSNQKININTSFDCLNIKFSIPTISHTIDLTFQLLFSKSRQKSEVTISNMNVYCVDITSKNKYPNLLSAEFLRFEKFDNELITYNYFDLSKINISISPLEIAIFNLLKDDLKPIIFMVINFIDTIKSQKEEYNMQQMKKRSQNMIIIPSKSIKKYQSISFKHSGLYISLSYNGVSQKIPFITLVITPAEVRMNEEHILSYSQMFTVTTQNHCSLIEDLVVEDCQFNANVSFEHNKYSFEISNLSVILTQKFLYSLHEYITLVKENDMRSNSVIRFKYSTSNNILSIKNDLGEKVMIQSKNHSFTLGPNETNDISTLAITDIVSIKYIVNSKEEEVKFSPDSLSYPLFLNSNIIVAISLERGTRVIHIRSPIRFRNKTSLPLSIYYISANSKYEKISDIDEKEECYLPFSVHRHSLFYITEKDFVSNGETPIPLTSFTIGSWKDRKGVIYSIATRNGPMKSHFKQIVDNSFSCGLIEISSCFTFFNELPYSLTITIPKQNYKIVIPSGKRGSISCEIDFVLSYSLAIPGFLQSELATIQTVVNEHTKDDITLLSEDRMKCINLIVKPEKVDKYLTNFYVYSSAILISEINDYSIAVSTTKDGCFFPFTKQSDSYSTFLFSGGLLNNLYFTIENETKPSVNPISAINIGDRKIIYLENQKHPLTYFPISCAVIDGPMQHKHSQIVMFSYALTVENKLNRPITMRPHIYTSQYVDNITIQCNEKRHITQSSNNLMFDINGSNGIILSKPSRFVVRLDGEICEFLIVEKNWGLYCQIMPLSKKPPIIVHNKTRQQIKLYQNQIRDSFVVEEFSTIPIALDSPFSSNQKVHLLFDYQDSNETHSIQKSQDLQIVPVTNTSNDIDFQSQIHSIQHNIDDNVSNQQFENDSITLSSDSLIDIQKFEDTIVDNKYIVRVRRIDNSTVITIYDKDKVDDERIVSLSLSIKNLTASLVTKNYYELALISLHGLNFSANGKNILNVSLTVNYLQIDDMVPHSALPVFIHANNFLTVSAKVNKFSLNDVEECTIQITNVEAYIDLYFIEELAVFFLKPLQTPKPLPPKCIANKLITAYLKKLTFKPVEITFSLRGRTGRPRNERKFPSEIKFIPDCTNTKVVIDGFTLDNAMGTPESIALMCVDKFKHNIIKVAPSVISNADILFSNVRVNGDITLSSVLRGGEHFVRTVSSYIGMIGSDDDPYKSPEALGITNDAKSAVKQGFLGFAGSVKSGIKGVITNPMEGAKSGGIKGGLKGLAKGLVGAVAKPVSGVLEAGAGLIGGAARAADSDNQLFQSYYQRKRIPRAFPNAMIQKEDVVVSQALYQIGLNRKGNSPIAVSLPNSPKRLLIVDERLVIFHNLSTNDPNIPIIITSFHASKSAITETSQILPTKCFIVSSKLQEMGCQSFICSFNTPEEEHAFESIIKSRQGISAFYQ